MQNSFRTREKVTLLLYNKGGYWGCGLFWKTLWLGDRGGFFCVFVVHMGIVFNTNSLFLVPIEQSLAIGRAQTMVAITLRGVAMVIGAFVSGYLYDRYAFMRIFRLSSMLLVITYALIAAVRTPMQYYILSTLHIMFMGIAGFIPVTMMVNRWFAAKTGTAMGFALLGSAIGGMLLSPVAGWLIPVWGWRMVNLLLRWRCFLW